MRACLEMVRDVWVIFSGIATAGTIAISFSLLWMGMIDPAAFLVPRHKPHESRHPVEMRDRDRIPPQAIPTTPGKE